MKFHLHPRVKLSDFDQPLDLILNINRPGSFASLRAAQRDKSTAGINPSIHPEVTLVTELS